MKATMMAATMIVSFTIERTVLRKRSMTQYSFAKANLKGRLSSRKYSCFTITDMDRAR
ncbi:hypothetical protein [Chelativorans alearense]|uniref:hypothetical protein n=1 Tax=Chelativorans alearense TaxID=2681495 RepID=UPI0013D47A3E|nr:hypothetical protein [Chelativorans alearense]